MRDDGGACDERDVVGDADNDIRADTADSLWDTVTVGDNPIRADIDDAHIPQQRCGGIKAEAPKYQKNNCTNKGVLRNKLR